LIRQAGGRSRILSNKELERKLPTKGTLVGNLIDEFRFG
jgi:hypothetical protein